MHQHLWSSYSIRILMSHSLTHSVTHSVTQSLSHSLTQSLSHSTKSVFKFDQNFFMSQTYRSYYAFNVPHLKFDLRKRIFGFLMKNFAYRILPGSPSEYHPCVWGGLLSRKSCQNVKNRKSRPVGRLTLQKQKNDSWSDFLSKIGFWNFLSCCNPSRRANFRRL